MCVTNVYVDRYPDGRDIEFRQTSFCPYGQPGRPCQKLSILENPVRKIQFGEPTTEFMMTAHQRVFPNTPPRSPHQRYSGGESISSAEGRHPTRRHSKRRSEALPILRPTRTHRKERIVIVDSPPTPRTPPQNFAQTFTAPSSPAAGTPFIINGDRFPLERGRPIIVDERPLHRPRVPSVGAVVGDRPVRRNTQRSPTRRSWEWESPSSSHTSFDSRREREIEETAERIRRDRDARIAELEADRRREEYIRQQDEDIRRRPAVPVPPRPLGQRDYLRPVVDQSQILQDRMAGLTIRDERLAILEEAEARRRLEARERAIQARMQAQEEEALKQRLRERQSPKRRFSVGPGGRRHRVLYDDGVYRWE